MNTYRLKFSFAAFVALLLVLPGMALCSTERLRHTGSLSPYTSNLDSRRAIIDRQLRKYRASEKPYPFETDRGGTLLAYTLGRCIRKVTLNMMVSRQDHIIEFYYSGKRLLMAAVTERSYIWEGGEEGDTNFSKFQDTHRLVYFRDGKMVCWRWAGQKKLHVEHITSYNGYEDNLLDSSRTCLATVFQKKKVSSLRKSK